MTTTDVPRALLTDREYDVLRRMANGLSNGEIGRELYMSEDTVKTHAHRMFRKMGARDRAHAVSIGYRLGLLTTGETVVLPERKTRAARPMSDRHKAACFASPSFGPPPSCRPEFHEAAS